VSTFVDIGVSRGQRGGSPMVVNLSFLDRITLSRDSKIQNKKCSPKLFHAFAATTYTMYAILVIGKTPLMTNENSDVVLKETASERQ
jgi:hypothetical protein